MGYTIAFFIGIILLGAAIFTFRQSRRMLETGIRTTATVAELEKVRGSETTTYRPIFVFKTLENREIRHTYFASSSPPAWKVGEQTMIVYDSNDPSKIRVLTFFGTYGPTLILLLIALPLTAIGAYHWL